MRVFIIGPADSEGRPSEKYLRAVVAHVMQGKPHEYVFESLEAAREGLRKHYADLDMLSYVTFDRSSVSCVVEVEINTAAKHVESVRGVLRMDLTVLDAKFEVKL